MHKTYLEILESDLIKIRNGEYYGSRKYDKPKITSTASSRTMKNRDLAMKQELHNQQFLELRVEDLRLFDLILSKKFVNPYM